MVLTVSSRCWCYCHLRTSPIALFLYGYLGNEKNLDVTQSLRRKDWNIVLLHYRGAWGSECEFLFRNVEQDVQTVLNYTCDPENSKALRIKSERNLIVIHSMDGNIAIVGLLDNQM